ncbi:MAG: translation initiation factor IF-6 [Desulfurococcaceae archaeon]|jgi:translation initiation factor 6|nr:translation initiation factor IF-6 [Desulfurococcaceae archaeon]
MEIGKMSFFGNPNIGVYAYANDELLLLPPGLGRDDIEELLSVLKTKIVIETKLAGTILIGVLVSGNNRAILLPHIVFDNDVEYLKKHIRENGLDLEIVVLDSKYTALGNLVLCNSRKCIISQLFNEREVEVIEDFLGVEVLRRRLVNTDLVGSVAVITDYGGVIHPDASDDDIKALRELMGVNVERATVNAGVVYVKSGIIANNKGVIIGGNTTGPEIFRIKRGFEGGVVE